MNLNRLKQQVKIVGELVGTTLTIEENYRVEEQILNLSSKFEQVNFFGKIKGRLYDQQMFVCCTQTNAVNFPHQKIFQVDSKEWTLMELPPANWADPRLKDCDELDDMFEGTCEHKYGITVNEEGEPEQAAEGDEAKGGKKERPLQELERLATTVRSVLHDCYIVPKGVLKMTTNQEFRVNPSFAFALKDAQGIQDFCHFRMITSKEKQQLLELKESIQRDDFLDELTSDIPAEQWSVQMNFDKSILYIKNLLWPGFVSQVVLGTNIHGCLQIGDGIKIKDFPFLI